MIIVIIAIISYFSYYLFGLVSSVSCLSQVGQCFNYRPGLPNQQEVRAFQQRQRTKWE